jgi:hypothetical protein
MWLASFSVKAVETVIGEIPYRLTRTTVPPTDAIYRIVSSQLKSRKERAAAAAVKITSFEELLKLIPQAPVTDQNLCRLYMLLVFEELVQSPKPDLSVMSDAMLKDTIYVQEQATQENPNLKQVASRVLRIIDSLEARTGSGEGAALARLRRFENAVRDEMKRQAVEARGSK